MFRKLIQTFAMLTVIALVYWAAKGFTPIDPTRLAAAGGFLVVASVLIWLKWDVAGAVRRKKLMGEGEDSRPAP